jgi:hypothetical protein
MALLPLSSQELPLLPPPLLSESKGFFHYLKGFSFLIFFIFFFYKKNPQVWWQIHPCLETASPSICTRGKLFFFLQLSLMNKNQIQHVFLLIFVNQKKKLQGFPSSVTPDYVPFQVWDLLQVKENQHKSRHAIVFEGTVRKCLENCC